MGHQLSSISETNRLYEMPLNQYGLKERTNSALSTWKNKSSPHDELIECRMVVNSEEDLRHIYDIFRMRHMHMYLPATKYLTCEQYGIKGCGQYYKGNIYLDSAVANLSLINDIPFIDSLHIYSVALKGFQILFRKFGYFDIFQDMFHICQNGKLKVWCNSQLYKLSPQPYLLDINGRQQDMIYRIVNIIDQNIDRSDQQNMKHLLYRKLPNGSHYKTFEQVNLVFRNICKQNNWQPPERLKCISQLTKEDIHKLIVQQHCLQNQNQSVRERDSKPMLPISSPDKHEINPANKQNNQGGTSIRVPVIQTPIKTSQPTQTQIQTQQTSQRPNNNTSLFHLLQNSEYERIRYNGTNTSIPNLNPNQSPNLKLNNISVSTIPPPNMQMIPKPQPRYLTTRSPTPEIRPRENIQVFENRPTMKIVSVEKNAPTQRINYIPYQNVYHIPPQLPPRLIQTTPQIMGSNVVTTSFVPKTQMMVHNSIQLSGLPQKESNINSLSGTAKFIQPPIPPLQRKQSKEHLQIRQNTKNQSNRQSSMKSSKNHKESNSNLHDASSKKSHRSDRSGSNDKSKSKIEQAKEQIKIPEKEIKYMDKKEVGFSAREDQKIIKSIILPQRSMNSGKSSNRSQHNQNNWKKSGIEQESYKYSIPQSIKHGPSTFNFEERFQQSIEPKQQILKKHKQSTSYFPTYTRPLSQKQSLTTHSNPYQNYTSPSQQLCTSKQYTDPKLLSMLSTPKNRTTAPNTTFPFNLNNELNASTNTNTNLSYLNKNSQLNTNQLYYSFSSNKNRDNKYQYQDVGILDSDLIKQSSKIKERSYESEANINYKYQQPDIMNNSQSQYKKYQTSIDTQIWKDLIQLKKHKNLY